MDDVWLIICNCPDSTSADALATSLVEDGVAACVNVMTGCASIYRWRGAVERASEVTILIKTTRGKYAKVESLIRAQHPYEVPEILAIPAVAGLPAYLDWVRGETLE